MLIDCHTCEVRDIACDDCVVTVLLGPTRLDSGTTFAEALPAGVAPLGVHQLGSVALDADERAALAVLADSGLVPPLRLVPPPGLVAGDDADLTRSAERTTSESAGHTSAESTGHAV